MNSQYKILIVEDEFIIANQLKELLQHEGFHLLEPADCYCAAIAQIEKELPDLIITDIKLYDDASGGIKISKYVSDFFNIPVIFLSGNSDDDTINKAKATNPYAFLIIHKPFDIEQLVATIKMALPNKKDLNNIQKMVSIKGRGVDENDIEKNTFEDLITHFIVYDDIVFIETANQYVKNTLLIHFNNKSNAILVRDDIEKLMHRLPNYFMRVHKSYIINSKNISAHKFPNYLQSNNHKIPIGDKFKVEVKKLLHERLAFVP